MLKAVIFDIDDTLYDFAGNHARALAAVEELAARELGVCRAVFHEAYLGAFRWQFAHHSGSVGCHSRAIRFQRALEALRLPVGHASRFNDFYWETLIGGVVPFAGTAALFDWLRGRGVLLGVGTDMTADWQIKKLVKLGLADKLDFVVTSEEAAAEKPAAAFFRLCLEKGRCRPDEAVFVGDNIDKDARGAVAMGMDGVWFQPDAAKRAANPDVMAVADMAGLLGALRRK